MSNDDLHNPNQSLLDRIKQLEWAYNELKQQHIDLLNEITPTATTRKTSFDLTQDEREFLGSIDPQGKNNMSRGLRMLIRVNKEDLEEME